MGFSQVTIANLSTLDDTAPGSVQVLLTQENNTTARAVITHPTADANGGELTGLTYVDAVFIQATPEEAEAFRNDFEGAKLDNGAQVDSYDVSGPTGVLDFSIAEPGQPYAILVRAADHPRVAK